MWSCRFQAPTTMLEEESVTPGWGHLAVSSRSGTRTWVGVRVPCRPGARVWQEQTFKEVPLSVPCVPGPDLVPCEWDLPGMCKTRPSVNRNTLMIVQASTIIPHLFFLHMSSKKFFFPLCFHFREKRDDPKNEGLSRVWKEKQVRKNTRLPRGHVFSGDQSNSAAYFNYFI